MDITFIALGLQRNLHAAAPAIQTGGRNRLTIGKAVPQTATESTEHTQLHLAHKEIKCAFMIDTCPGIIPIRIESPPIKLD